MLMNKIKPNIEELQLIQVPQSRLCVNKTCWVCETI